MINYCTLFNSRYLSRGLAMYRSLEKHCKDFHLYIFAFDELCYDTLCNLNLRYATIISLSEFEDEHLLSIKPTRMENEYCWTCTPSVIRYSINEYQLSSCTYLDADLLFFSDPAILIQEMEERSVLITEHRYTPRHDQSVTSGIYCVQFICFKNTEEGMRVLDWWRNACLEWCYCRVQDGKFGDQKYLDDWMTRFTGIHELKALGGGVAPWNIQQYDFAFRDQQLYGKDLASSSFFPVVFYHYHGFKYAEANSFIPTNGYDLSSNDLHFIYQPYVKALKLADKELAKLNLKYHFHEVQKIERIGKSPRRMLLLYITGQFRQFYHSSYFFRKWPFKSI